MRCLKYAVLLMSGAIFLSACAAPEKYHWGSYEQDLLTYYKDNGQQIILVENLGMMIEKGEEQGRVPPGIYAEYGYLLLESGKFDDSVTFFRKEQESWPESETLMNAMIRIAETEAKKQ
ncbi:DUF4810 domain-containing protein [Kiloniella laminariae]|uniref:DUF4810 domain-containing protein n=1 Tax=Kiloniella laminariae TaxID=454162 RepID=A0ABT4LDI8_9PROT|nr:DUF4810 domain-containing protein [Kiloniella laminariae]MCZ4279153.1 DUF4810 domain-containing protein [Kiloniella laminariae]